MVERTGNLDEDVEVDFYCEEGSAKPGKRYQDVSGTLKFANRKTEASIRVMLIQNDPEYIPEAKFKIHLRNARFINTECT